ncbi:MAG: mannose-1-phosphate guanylyltransferase [Deltaproteobacteria bacterium]|nr:mannose-1-phosphate guanylyltransferase [Deltaproteobacteria bacterium]
MYAVIMAGGRGTRFWPLSRECRPKHLLCMTGDRSIIRCTVDRIQPLVPAADTIIVTAANHAADVCRELPEIPEQNIIIEPMGRNTAPCICLAALYLVKRDPDAIMAVLPSDHLVLDEEKFIDTLAAARDAAARGSHLVTIGIRPTAPETGYGYVERGPKIDEIRGRAVYDVASFREKPDRETAETYVKTGSFLWNSGMFLWKASAILEEIQRFLPEMYETLSAVSDSLGTTAERDALAGAYSRITPVSIDYGVLEMARNVLCVEGDFRWSDLGSWDALWEILEKDPDGNALQGNIVTADTRNTLVLGGEKLLALVGIEDIIVVETGDSLMICKRGHSQEVRKIVEELEGKQRKEYL